MRLTAIAAMTVALAACAAPQRGPSNEVINRVLVGVPGEAQPSRIVAAEIAFSRTGQEQGVRTALQQFATFGGQIHLGEGVVDVASAGGFNNDPSEAPEWGTRSVWMSCDGATAVSQGRFRDKDGIVGNYTAVWERQSDTDYRYSYFVFGPDNPQPPPREAPQEGDIVVTALDSIRADVADCARRGETVPTPPPVAIGDGYTEGGKLSRDGTLRWRWVQYDDTRRRFVLDYLSKGSWQTAYDEFFNLALETEE